MQATISPSETNEELTRFSGYLDVNKLITAPTCIIGCGAIGRQIALQLAAMGNRNMTLVDFDKVDTVNIGVQGWGVGDIGKFKVDAMNAEILSKHNFCPDTDGCAWPPDDEGKLDVFFDQGQTPYFFFAVDSIGVRNQMWQALRSKVNCNIIDTRMGINTCNVISCGASFSNDLHWYSKTLFPEAEAEQAPCTMKSTLYCANIAAGFAVSQFVEGLRCEEGRADSDFLNHHLLINIPCGLIETGQE